MVGTWLDWLMILEFLIKLSDLAFSEVCFWHCNDFFEYLVFEKFKCFFLNDKFLPKTPKTKTINEFIEKNKTKTEQKYAFKKDAYTILSKIFENK